MKYREEDYLGCGFYPPGEGERNHKESIRKARKSYLCVNCHRDINKGDKYLHESCILEGMGRAHSHTCLMCLDEWLEGHNYA